MTDERQTQPLQTAVADATRGPARQASQPPGMSEMMLAPTLRSVVEAGDIDPRGETNPDPSARSQLSPELSPRIGRYELVRELGSGGMARVFEAFDPATERRIALKVLSEPEAGPVEGARLLREAQFLATLSHPNIVGVADVGIDHGSIFIAVELVHGEDLRNWLQSESREWRDIVEVFVAAGRGLAAAHSAGVVHRDFKPANVIIDASGPVRLVDFGIAKSARTVDVPTRHPKAPAFGDLTQAGELMGTPLYMAPEVLAGRDADARSDQYSFCVALYEGLYGVVPFDGRTIDELLASIRRSQPRAALEGRAAPERLRRAVLRGLSVRPEDRWPSMEALLAALTGADKAAMVRLILLAALSLLVLLVAGLSVHAWS